MVDPLEVTLERGGTTINLPVVADSSGTPLISRDTGKPNLDIQSNSAAPDPGFNDYYSGLQTFTIVGRFARDSAHSDAIALADMVKNHGQGSPITLNIPLNEYDDNIKVVPAAEQQRAVSFSYEAGKKNWVTVDLRLTRISLFQGADSIESQFISNTPTASGSGPITLTDGSNSVSFEKGVNVERTVGRPNSTLSKRTDKPYPAFQEKVKTAYDAFDLSFEFNDNTVSKIRTLNDMIAQRLQRVPLELQFNGTYGLGTIKTVPVGSQAQRDVRPSGHQGVSLVPTLNLRVARELA